MFQSNMERLRNIKEISIINIILPVYLFFLNIVIQYKKINFIIFILEKNQNSSYLYILNKIHIKWKHISGFSF